MCNPLLCFQISWKIIPEYEVHSGKKQDIRQGERIIQSIVCDRMSWLWDNFRRGRGLPQFSRVFGMIKPPVHLPWLRDWGDTYAIIVQIPPFHFMYNFTRRPRGETFMAREVTCWGLLFQSTTSWLCEVCTYTAKSHILKPQPTRIWKAFIYVLWVIRHRFPMSRKLDSFLEAGTVKFRRGRDQNSRLSEW